MFCWQYHAFLSALIYAGSLEMRQLGSLFLFVICQSVAYPLMHDIHGQERESIKTMPVVRRNYSLKLICQSEVERNYITWINMTKILKYSAVYLRTWEFHVIIICQRGLFILKAVATGGGGVRHPPIIALE